MTTTGEQIINLKFPTLLCPSLHIFCLDQLL